MNIKKYISKISKKHLMILFSVVILMFGCVFTYNKLQEKIVVTSNLIDDSISSNLLNKKYQVLRAEVIEKGFFIKHNELFLDISTDENWKFYDAQQLGIEVDKTFTSKYSINNIHFNIYKSADDFVANYDDSDNKSIFSLVSDYKKSDTAKLTQYISNQNIDITKSTNDDGLYNDLFTYTILDANKKNSNIIIQLTSNNAPIDSSYNDLILSGMQLLERDIRNLNSNCKDINIKVYNSLSDDTKDKIYSSSYWEFDSNNKTSLQLSKDIKIHSNNNEITNNASTDTTSN